MTERRIDRIVRILEGHQGKASLHDVLAELRRDECNPDIVYPSLHVAIQAENERLERLGKRRRFRTARDGGERGWVSLESISGFEPGSHAHEAEAKVLKANQQVDEDLRASLLSMSWRRFEDAFLTRVLEKLGFQDVQITQASRDGGVDARVSYKRGLVEARAIVSAKRWSAKATVGVEEVRNLRGIKGDEDTAIIITTGRFSTDAKDEVKPSQGLRAVYLIDGDRLVEMCKEHGIGIKRQSLTLLVVDEEDFAPGGADAQSDSGGQASPGEDSARDNSEESTSVKSSRFRDEMLGDGERGITAAEAASLVGLKESTVKVYLGDEKRRAELGDRIREDPELRVRALKMVSRRRGS